MARELTDIIAWRGKPGMIVSDNGTEFTANAILVWCKDLALTKHRMGLVVRTIGIARASARIRQPKIHT